MSQRRGGSTGARRKSAGPSSGGREWLLGVALVLLVAVLGGTAVVRKQGQAARLRAAVEVLPDEGANHVPAGTKVTYHSDPPTSGPHYDDTAAPNFYSEPVAPELLVHNLEHGHVVIYYDPQRLSAAARSHIQRLTSRYRGTWDAVLAVPRRDPEYELILTAWRRRLRLTQYDPGLVNAFVDAFRGRGPENPVR